MKIIYQSKNYSPIDCVSRYLKVNHNNEVVIVDSNASNYTIRTYILDESEYENYKNEIKQAKERQHIYPPFIELVKIKSL